MDATEITIKKLTDLLKSNPKDIAAFRGLEEHYFHSQNWKKLSELYQFRASSIKQSNANEASHLYFKSGDILEKRLGNRDEAIAAYQQAFSLNQQKKEYGDILVQFYCAQENWQKALDVLQNQVKATAPNMRAELLLKIAVLWKDRIKNKAEAKKSLQQVLSLNKNDENALRLLEEMYYEDKEWPNLLELYKYRLEATSEPKLRGKILERCALLCKEELKDYEQAIQYYGGMLQIAPNDLAVLHAMEELYSQTGNWQHLADVVKRQVPLIQDNKEKAGALSRLASILTEKLKNQAEAAQCYEQVFAIGADPSVLGILEDIYSRQEDWKRLAGVYERKARLSSDPKVQIELYCKIAGLAEERLQDLDTAIKWYQAAHQMKGPDMGLLKTLQRLLVRKGNAVALVENYYQEIELISDRGARLDIYEKIAALYKEQRNLQAAAGVYEKVVAEYPDLKVLENLKALYQTLEDYPALIRALEREAAIISNPQATVGAYLKIAEIFKEKMGQEEQGIGYYRKILEIDRTNLAIWEKLQDYYTRTGNHSALISVLENIVRLDPKRTESGYLQIAQIYRDNLGSTESALEAYKKVLSFNSRNLEAIKALQTVYKAQNAWQPYREILCKQIEIVVDPEQMVALLFKVCEAHRHLNDVESEKTHLKAILKVQHDNKAALSQLKNIYSQQQNWPELVALLEKEPQLFGWDMGTVFERYLEIAQIYLEKLNDVERAIDYYEKAKHINPNHPQVLDNLENLYSQTKNYRKLVDILSAKAQLSEKEADALPLYHRMGIIWGDRLQDQVQAIRCFRRIIDTDLANMAALRRLKGLYQAREEYENLAEICLRECDAVTDQAQQVLLNMECGKIWEEKLHKLSKAMECYARVVRLEPKNVEAVERLFQLHRQEQNWAGLAGVYEKKIALVEDRAEVIRLSFESAVLWRDQLQVPTKAIEVYNRILSLDAENLQAILALKELYGKLSLWDDLLKVLEKEYELTAAPNQKEDLAVQMAKLCEETFKFEESIAHYRTALQYDPQHIPFIHALRRIYYQTQDYPMVVWSIDEELKYNPPQPLDLLFERGDLLTRQLADPARAVDTFNALLELDPANARAYENIAAIYRFQQDYEKLVETLERQIQVAPPEQQKQLWMQSSVLWKDYLENNERARENLQQVLKLDTAFQPARDALAEIYRELAQWNDLIALYREEISFSQDKDRIAYLHCEIGKISETELASEDEALKYYRQAQEIVPSALFAIQSLQRIYRKQGRLPELLAAYLSELGLPEIERERRIYLYIEAAELQRKLGGLEGAIQSYLAILDFSLDPNNLVSVRGLEEIYEQQEKYKDFQNMLFKELELQKDPNRLIEVHLHLAAVMEEKLNEPDVAIEHYSEAHLSRSNSVIILRHLKKLLRARERWEKYADALEKEIALSSFPSEIVPLHRELLDIYDAKTNVPEKAIAHGEALLELDKDDLDAILKLEALYEKVGQIEKLIDLYLREAELRSPETESERLVFLYATSGKLYHSPLENLPGAAGCYQKVLEFDPAHKEAISKLAKILTTLKQWEELIKLYELTARITRNKTEKETVYLKIGELWEKEFQKLKEALLSYQIAYSMNPKNLGAVTGMCRIFEHQERWGDLVEFLNVQAYLVEEKKQPALFLKMGEIWQEKLNMPQQALTCYLKVMGHGFHRGTAERIMQIQQEVGDFEGWAEILLRDIRVTEKPEELIPKLLTLAQIEWRHLNHPEEATDLYTKVLKLQGNEMEAINSLTILLPLQKKWKETIAILNRKRENLSEPDLLLEVYLAIGELYDAKLHVGNQAIRYYEYALDLAPQEMRLIHTLQRLYRDWGYFKKLINLNLKEISLINEVERLVALYKEIGETWEKRLFAEEQAIRAYEKLLEILPSHIESTRALARLYRKHQAWEKLIAVYRQLIEDARKRQDKAEEIKIELALGALYRDELRDMTAAIDAFKRILDIEPAHEEALAALEKLYQTVNKTADMAELLQQKLSMCKDDKERIELYVHLGTLYEKELDDPDRAIEAFLHALEIDPRRLSVLKALDWLYLRKNKWEELSGICIREYELIAELPEKAELCYRLGIMYRDRFQQVDKALEWFGKAVECQPAMRKALKALTGIAILKEDWTQAVRNISQEIEHIDNPHEKVEALTDLGSLYEGKLKLIQKAKETFQLALDIDPKSVVSMEAMTNIHFLQGEWAQAEVLLGRLSLLLDKAESEKLSEIYYKWGLAAERLGKKDEAIIRYNSSLASRPDHLNALAALGNLYFERAQWGLHKAQWQEALDVYQKISQHPDLEEKQEVTRRLAMIQYRLELKREAIDNYRKVLVEAPDNMEVILAIAKLYIEMNEQEYALEYLNRVVKSESASFQDKRKALVIISEVLTGMEKHREAIDACQKAFSMGLEEPKVLRGLGELYMKVQDWGHAQEWLDKHYECLEDPTDKVENRCLVAKLALEGRNRIDEALALYREALAIVSTYIPAIQGIAAIYEREEKWEELAQNYRDFLTNIPEADKAIGIPIHLALGGVYLEKLGDPVRAVEEYKKVLELDTEHIAARSAIANIKAQDPLLQEDAIQEHQLLLRNAPFRVDSYRAFYKIFREREEIDRAYRSCRTLAFLNSAIPEEQQFLQSIKIRPIKNMDLERVGWYMIPAPARAHQELMALTSVHMTKVYTVDMEQKYSLRPRKDRLAEGAETLGKTWKMIEQLQSLMGIQELDVYLYPKKVPHIYLENTQPASMIISQGVLESFSEPELKFLLAKYLFYVAQKQILALTLEEKDVKQYFYALQCIFQGTDAKAAEDEAVLKKIRGYLPRKVRKALEERPDLWRELAKSDAAQYVKSIDYASNRCALAITDSLDLCVQMTYRFGTLQKTGRLIPVAKLPAQELAKSEMISDLLLYNISEEYGKLRKATGMDVYFQPNLE